MDNLFLSIFPTICIYCNKIGPMICDGCALKCLVIEEPVCLVCGESSMEGFTHTSCFQKGHPTQLFSCFEYGLRVKKAIEISKHPPFEYQSIKELTRHGVEFAKSVGYHPLEFIVVPVPLLREVYRKRGFNQSALISSVFSSSYGLTLDLSSLIRVEDEYFANPKRVKNMRVMLVDDICITGSTLLKCSQALYTAGAAEVRCFTLSQVL